MKTLIAERRATKAIDQIPVTTGAGAYDIPLSDLRYRWPGLGVTADTALNVITVLQCVDKVAKTFASLPLFVYRRQTREDGTEGRTIAREHRLYKTLHDRPNPSMTSFVWREILMANLKTWGNHFSEIVEYPNALELWPIRPDRIRVDWGSDGQKDFWYLSPLGGEKLMKPGSVFHLQGMSSNGLVGMSPIELMRRTIAVTRSAERYGEAVFDNGARPAIVMTHPQTLSDDATGRLGAQMDALRGAGNAGKTVVLEEGLSITEVGFPPEDAQFMETRLFQKRELAAYYDIPGIMVGDPDGDEDWDDASRRFMSLGIQSELERFEQEVQRQLLPGEDDVYAEFKADGWLRADPKARADAYAVQWEHGSLNNDEWRNYENMDPLPDGQGKVFYRPANWVPLGESPVAVGGQTSEATQFGAERSNTPPPAEVVPQLTRVKSVRCPSCDKLLIEDLQGGVKMTCERCKTKVEVA